MTKMSCIDLPFTTSTLLVTVPPWDPGVPPLALASLAGHLRREEREVQVLDLNNLIFRQADPEQHGLWQPGLDPAMLAEAFTSAELAGPLDELAQKLASSPVKVVGLSITAASVGVAIYLVERIREASEELLVVVGGPGTADGKMREVLIEAGVDYLVVGEGELTLQALLSPLLRGQDAPPTEGVVPSPRRAQFPFRPRPPADLANVGLPDFDDFELDHYRAPGAEKRLVLQTSRGCPSECAFCVDRPATPFRVFPPQLVAGLMVHLARELRIDQVEFSDLVVNGRPEALKQWCELLAQQQHRMFWTGQFTFNSETTLEVLLAVRRSGCISARFGLESGSNRLLDLMGKGYDTRVASQVLRDARQAGLRTEINLMVGFPGETEQDFQQTLEFVLEHQACISKVNLITICQLHPGCALRATPENFGVLPRDLSAGFLDQAGNTGDSRNRRALQLAHDLALRGMRLGEVLDDCQREGLTNPEFTEFRGEQESARLEAHSVQVEDLCVTLDDGGTNVSINAGELPLSSSPGLGLTLQIDDRFVDMTDGRWAAWNDGQGVVHLESAPLFAPVRIHLCVSVVEDRLIVMLELLPEQPVRLQTVRVGLLLSGALVRWAGIGGAGRLELESTDLDEVLLCEPPAAYILLAGDQQDPGDDQPDPARDQRYPHVPRLSIQLTDGLYWDIKLARDPRGRRLLLDRTLDSDSGGRLLEPGVHQLFSAELGLLQEEPQLEETTKQRELDRFRSDFALVLCPPWAVQTPPLWLATLAAALRGQDLSGSCHDLNALAHENLAAEHPQLWEPGRQLSWRLEQGFEEHWGLLEPLLEAAAEQILEQLPEVVCFSTTEANLRCCLRLAIRLKQAMPQTTVVFGGPGIYWTRPSGDGQLPVNLLDPWSGLPLDPHEVVDLYLRGEADESLPELLRRLQQGRDPLSVPGAMACHGGRWVSPRPPLWPTDLDRLPAPDYSDLNLASHPTHTAPLLLARGCNQACTTCNACQMQGPLRSRDPRRVMEELTELHRRYQIQGLAPADLALNADPARLGQLCDLLASSELPTLGWSAQCQVSGLDPELLQKMAHAGCRELVLGLDSLAQPVVDAMRKDFVVGDAMVLLRQARAAGLETTISLIVGYPRETSELFDKTLRTLVQEHDVISRIASISACNLTRGSRLWETPDRYGIDTRGEAPWYNWRGPLGNDRTERRRRAAALRAEALRLGIEVLEDQDRDEDGEQWELVQALVPSY